MSFPEFVRRLHALFTEDHELYAVGGCVRDWLLGRDVGEYDLATDARPAAIRTLLEAAHPDAMYSMGEKFGTVGAIFHGTRVEITTYRGEWYEPGSRKPHVEFGSSLEEDLKRRDFTVNAIAQEIDTLRLLDPMEGERDLQLRLIRAVGSADDRFRDDPLRLLRAVRFASTLGFKLEPQTADSIRRNAPELNQISRERIRDEMTRMLTGPAPDSAVRQLVELGLMEYILPELLELRAVATGGGKHKDIFEHTLKVLAHTPPGLVVRWSALLHDIAKPRTVGYKDGKLHFNGHEQVGAQMSRKMLSGLRYDRPTIDAVQTVVEMHTHVNAYSEEWSDGAVRRLVRDAGDALEPLLALSEADITSYHAHKREAASRRVAELRERIARLEAEASIKALRPPIDGGDLMAMFGRPPGPWIRPIKAYLLDLVIDGALGPDDRETAERLVREKYAELEEANS